MALKFKNARDLAGIYRSGQIAGAFLRDVAQLINPGVTTKELDDFGAEYIAKHGGKAAFLGYNGFPASLCISINEEIVHGIPGPRRLEPGDIVSIDVGVILEGYVSDTARTYLAGDAPPAADVQRLLSGTASSLDCAIGAIRDGIPLRLVSRAIEQELLKHHLGIVHELTGHGTGFALHEEPTVYNFDPRARKPMISNGMVLAIEPMATLGSPEILLAADNWCYKSADGSLAAHYEHTIACWDGRALVLTDPAADDSRQAFGGGA